MTKDYTVAVNELRNHYNELTAHKKSIRAMVKAEFEAKIDFEIQRRIEAAELKFANHVAAVKERENLPVSIIQDHVLRTRTWSRWEKWRDLAGLEPEFVTAEAVRQANRPVKFRIEQAGPEWFITAYESAEGKKIEPYRVRIDVALSESRYKKGEPYYDIAWDQGESREYNRNPIGGWAGFRALHETVREELARAHAAGEIPDILNQQETVARLND